VTDDLAYSDDYLREILARTRTIAQVGATQKSNRPAYLVMKYLQGKGYRVFPVNPAFAGEEILGERVYPDLKSVPEPIDLVQVFRRSEFAGAVTDEAIAAGAKVVWMQLGVRDDAAAQRATAAGLDVFMNRCPKIELDRLAGELP
jgi:O-acetylhomoserine (thiol)-lyase